MRLEATASSYILAARPDGWARGEREGCGEPCDVTSLSLAAGGALVIYWIIHRSVGRGGEECGGGVEEVLGVRGGGGGGAHSRSDVAARNNF